MNTQSILNFTPNITSYLKIRAMFRSFGNTDHLDLILLTAQGNVDEAFFIARYLRKRFTTLRVIMPTMSYGPGNLIAMVADEWVFGELGGIGPMTDTWEAQEIFECYETDLANITPHLHPDTARKLIMLDPEGDCIITEAHASEVSVKIGNLTTNDQDMLTRYNAVVQHPLRNGTFICIENDEGQYAEYSKQDDLFPIVPVRSVASLAI